MDPNNGYDWVYQERITRPKRPVNRKTGHVLPRLSVLEAGIELRNAIHHDYIRSTAPFQFIFPFYQDIVLRVLEAFQFLDGSSYQFVYLDRNKGELERLHGQTPVRWEIERDHPIFSKKSDLFLYRLATNDYIPLYPLFIAEIDKWDIQKEFVLESISLGDRWASFIGRRNYVRRESGVLFEFIQDRLEKKEQGLKRPVLSIRDFRERAAFISQQTLENAYLQYRYFPDCYLSRQSLDAHFNAFIHDPSKVAMLVKSEAGTGKSAWLAHLTHSHLEDSASEILPIFLNAAEFQNKAENYTTYLGTLLGTAFYLTENTFKSGLTGLLRNIQDLYEQNAEALPSTVLFIIDAVNESHDQKALFEAIDAFLLSTLLEGVPQYKWFKLICSTRYLDVQSGTEISSFLDKRTVQRFAHYYDPNSSEQSSVLTGALPYLSLPALSHEEAMKIFQLYARSDQFRHLREIKDPATLIRENAEFLSRPLWLRLWAEVIDRNGGLHLEQRYGADQILALFYDALVNQAQHTYLEECLDKLCRLMIQNNGSYVKMAQWYDLRQQYDQQLAELPLYTVNPAERLLHQHIVRAHTQELIEQGGKKKEYQTISFTYQKFAEHVLFRLFQKEPGQSPAQQLLFYLNKPVQFSEYNQALILLAKPLWQSSQYKTLAALPVDQPAYPHRYTEILVDTILAGWADKIVQGNQSSHQLLVKQNTALIESWHRQLKNLWADPIVRSQHRTFIPILYSKAQALLADVPYLNEPYDKVLLLIQEWYQHHVPETVDAATFWLTYAKRTSDLGNLQQALLLLLQLQEWLNAWLQEHPLDVLAYILSLKSYAFMGVLNQKLLNDEEALTNFTRCTDLLDYMESLPQRPSDYLELKTYVFGLLGGWYASQFAFTEARSHYEQQRKYLEKLSRLTYYLELANNYHQLAQIASLLQDDKQEVELREQALALLTNHAPKRHSSPFLQLQAELKIGLAISYSRFNHSVKAAHKLIEDGISLAKQLLDTDPANETLWTLLQQAYRSQATMLINMGQYSLAIRALDAAIKLAIESTPRSETNESHHLTLAYLYNQLAGVYRKAGKLNESKKWLNQSNTNLQLLDPREIPSERVRRGHIDSFLQIAQSMDYEPFQLIPFSLLRSLKFRYTRSSPFIYMLEWRLSYFRRTSRQRQNDWVSRFELIDTYHTLAYLYTYYKRPGFAKACLMDSFDLINRLRASGYKSYWLDIQYIVNAFLEAKEDYYLYTVNRRYPILLKDAVEHIEKAAQAIDLVVHTSGIWCRLEWQLYRVNIYISLNHLYRQQARYSDAEESIRKIQASTEAVLQSDLAPETKQRILFDVSVNQAYTALDQHHYLAAAQAFQQPLNALGKAELSFHPVIFADYIRRCCIGLVTCYKVQGQISMAVLAIKKGQYLLSGGLRFYRTYGRIYWYTQIQLAFHRLRLRFVQDAD